MLYVVPSIVSVAPSLVHVTVVAGEPVEVQFTVVVPQSYVRLDTVGGAEGKKALSYLSVHLSADCKHHIHAEPVSPA